VGGGNNTSLAGNLAAGASPNLCNGCGTTSNQVLIALAVDDSNVYLADHAFGVEKLLQVPK
jgi:hypothetical protein